MNFGPTMNATVFHLQTLETMMREELKGKPFPAGDPILDAYEDVRAALSYLKNARTKTEQAGHRG